MAGIVLYISFFPSQTMKDLFREGKATKVYESLQCGELSDGNPFKVVRPIDVPGTSSRNSGNLSGLRLRSVVVVPPAAISHDQKEWLLSRRRVITKGEFIS